MSKELQKIENIQNISKLSVGERINYLNKLKRKLYKMKIIFILRYTMT